jgi:hypothetical protein
MEAFEAEIIVVGPRESVASYKQFWNLLSQSLQYFDSYQQFHQTNSNLLINTAMMNIRNYPYGGVKYDYPHDGSKYMIIDI